MENYLEPEMEVITLDSEDVIITSLCDSNTGEACPLDD